MDVPTAIEPLTSAVQAPINRCQMLAERHCVPIPTKPPVCNGMIAPRDSWMMPPPCNEMIPPGAPRLLA